MNILILLIGSNPLPNYVVGNYFSSICDFETIPCPDTIMMLHSQKTEHFANNIAQLLKYKIKAEIKIEKVKIEPNEPEDIKNKINSWLSNKANEKNILSVHINHTGGTKIMAVNSYVTCHEFCNKNHINFIASDLAGDDYKLRIQGSPDNLPEKIPYEYDLRDVIKITLEELMQLHNIAYETTTKMNLNFSITDFADDIINLIDMKNPNGSLMLSKIKKSLSNYSKMEEYVLKSELDKILNNNEYGPINKIIKKYIDFFSNAKSFIEFLNGKWLEYYIYNVIIELKKRNSISFDDIQTGIIATYKGRLMELDILAIKGYQLYLISCTTSNENKIIKNKAFEAIYRSEQIGGEHSKAIIATMAFNQKINQLPFSYDNNIYELRKDLEQFDTAINCTLTGIDEIRNELSKNFHAAKFSDQLRRVIK